MIPRLHDPLSVKRRSRFVLKLSTGDSRVIHKNRLLSTIRFVFALISPQLYGIIPIVKKRRSTGAKWREATSLTPGEKARAL